MASVTSWMAAVVIALAAVVVYNTSTIFHPAHSTSVARGSPGADYDYVVVGGGTAGPVVAARLSEDPGVTVLLLEAGGDYTENELFHVPLHYTAYQRSAADWQYYTVPQTHSSLGLKDHKSFWPKGRVLGGSNLFNALQYSRGSRHDYDEWEASGCKGWGYKDVLPYFLKSEDNRMPEVMDSPYHSTGGPIAVSSAAVTPLADVYLAAGRDMGYQHVDNNGPRQEGFSYNPITVRDGIRSSSALEYLKVANGRKNLHISLHSFVTKVKVENQHASGVYVIINGRKRFIKARKEVILSAGSINTPQILMLSGIGPKEHLEEMGIGVVADLPVGKNLQDHLIMIVKSGLNTDMGISVAVRDSWMTSLQYRLFGTGVLASSTNEVTAFFCSLPDSPEDCAADVQFMISSKYFKAIVNLFGFEDKLFDEFYALSGSPEVLIAISHLDPRSVGTIRLRSDDPYDHPLIDPRYLTDRHDVDAYIRGARLWEDFIMTPTMQKYGANFDRVNISVCSQHDFRSDDFWECYTRHVAVTCYHPVGTCKMGGEGDASAVVDPSLRVRGVSGLRVADGSVMPAVVSGNTNAAITMIAEKATDLISGRDTVRQLRDRLAAII